MIRHLFVAALRNMAASKLLSAIAIGSLTIGLTAAILAGLVIRSQLQYDHFIAGYQQVYFVTLELRSNQEPPGYGYSTPHDLAAHIRQNFPDVAAVTRLVAGGAHSLRHGDVEAVEQTYEAAPNAFAVLRLPTLFGDLAHALDRPDGIVIPRAIARKYFGRDNVVGERLTMDRQHPLTITAVIADLPDNESNLQTAIFVSGQSAYAATAAMDQSEPNGLAGGFIVDSRTLLRLSPHVPAQAVEHRMQQMRDVLLPHGANITLAMPFLTPIGQLHISSDIFPEVQERLAVIGAATFLIWFLANFNFVNLLVARSVQRELEVGVRKVTGADRARLMFQFLGESLVQATLALCLALVLVEWLLPAINALLDTGAVLDYGHDPSVVALMILGAVTTGLIAGIYPALILSGFRPALVLNKMSREPARTGLVREGLVALQFAILIGLIIAAAAAFQQYRYVVRNAVHLNTDQIMFVQSHGCEGNFKTRAMALPGVEGAACSTRSLLQLGNTYSLFRRPDGTMLDVLQMNVGPGLMELYGLKPLAGRFMAVNGADKARAGLSPDSPRHVVLNETAVKKIGFASPEAAIGKVLTLEPFRVVVIGVVPDFWIYSGRRVVDPVVYYDNPVGLDPRPGGGSNVLIHIKVDADRMATTLRAIDALWNSTDAYGPVQRNFMADYIQSLWLPLMREGQAFSMLAAIGVLLACLGLFAMSLTVAQRRTKEIGIRKAMGAQNAEILALLLWQFGRPVVWANLIAWPLTWWLVRRWLAGFPYHIELELWPFVTAGVVSLGLALITVAAQALLVARQKPVLALRYE